MSTFINHNVFGQRFTHFHLCGAINSLVFCIGRHENLIWNRLTLFLFSDSINFYVQETFQNKWKSINFRILYLYLWVFILFITIIYNFRNYFYQYLLPNINLVQFAILLPKSSIFNTNKQHENAVANHTFCC